MQHLISLHEGLIDIREDGNLQAEFQQNLLHNWRMEFENYYHDLVSPVNVLPGCDLAILGGAFFQGCWLLKPRIQISKTQNPTCKSSTTLLLLQIFTITK